MSNTETEQEMTVEVETNRLVTYKTLVRFDVDTNGDPLFRPGPPVIRNDFGAKLTVNELRLMLKDVERAIVRAENEDKA